MTLSILVFILSALLLLFVYSERKRAKVPGDKDLIIPRTGIKKQYHSEVVKAAGHVLDARLKLTTSKAARDLLPRGMSLAEIKDVERNIHEQEMLLVYLEDRLAWLRKEFPPVEVPKK